MLLQAGHSAMFILQLGKSKTCKNACSLAGSTANTMGKTPAAPLPRWGQPALG